MSRPSREDWEFVQVHIDGAPGFIDGRFPRGEPE